MFNNNMIWILFLFLGLMIITNMLGFLTTILLHVSSPTINVTSYKFDKSLSGSVDVFKLENLTCVSVSDGMSRNLWCDTNARLP